MLSLVSDTQPQTWLNLAPIKFNDLHATWPSRHLGGPVHLGADGSWSSPEGSGQCKIGEVVTIDPTFPKFAYARWTGRDWSYQTRGTGLKLA